MIESIVTLLLLVRLVLLFSFLTFLSILIPCIPYLNNHLSSRRSDIQVCNVYHCRFKYIMFVLI